MKHKRLITSAALVAIATVLVRFSGFIREVVLAAIYGAGSVSDAFVIAFTAPDIVLTVIGSSTAVAFIPTFARMENLKEKFTSNLLTILALIGLVFSLVFTIVPQALTYLLASQLDADTFANATSLLRIMVWAAIPILLSRVLQSYLQIQKSFFLAALLTVPINIAAIISIVLSRTATMTILMGYGVLAGNAITLAYMLAASRRKGYTYHPALKLRAPELRGLFILMAPILLSTLISDLNTIVDRNFASSLASGSISSLNYANRTVGVLTALIGQAAATVLYPRLAELSAQGKTDEMRKIMSSSIKMLTPVLLPMVVGVILLAKPLVFIMFERGDFTSYDTQRTAECLMMYATLILATSITAVLNRAMFSLYDSKTPAIVTALSVAIGIAIKFLMIGRFSHIGLALASSIAGLLTMLLLMLALRKRLGGLRLKSDNWEWVKTFIATALMGAAVGFGVRFLPVMAGGTMQCVLITGGLIFAGAGVYFLSHMVMRTLFLQEMIKFVRRLLSKPA